MAKVILKYNDVAVGEIPIGKKIVAIGRSKDNNIVIDHYLVVYYVV
jgi:pSer/pThr/pTyr-binding forkhead associated (FHA) protein